MAARTFNDYFLQPEDAIQRRYETLRSVFVEGLSLKDAAQRFQVSYGTVRNWASEFRRAFQAGQRPPFSPVHPVDAPQTGVRRMTTSRTSKSPMPGRCRWKQDAA